jgi:hypothetical protein
MSVHRRAFLSAAGALPFCSLPFERQAGSARGAAATPRPRLAAVATVYHKYSHAQHLVDRFLEGFGWQGAHHYPACDVVALYVEQTGDDDLSRERLGRHPGLKRYPSVAEALTRGGSELAVDGVLLIGEHGEYPTNEKGQKLYPRYEFFQQIVGVFRDSRRSVPVFNDKHLSWNWDHAREMVDTAREMGFPLMAGSSLPVTWRIPSIDLPWRADAEEIVGIYRGGGEGADIHVLEAMQCLAERRRGGETGVVSAEALQGERFWQALDAGSWQAGGWDRRLMDAALARSHELKPARETYNHVFPTRDELQRLSPEAYAYRFEYADGFRATMLQMPGLVGDCTAAVRLRDSEIVSLLFYLPYRQLRNFFSPQVRHIESLFLTGKSPYPVERTLLTTGMTAAGVESSFQQQQRIATPHLAIAYQPVEASLFWRS